MYHIINVKIAKKVKLCDLPIPHTEEGHPIQRTSKIVSAMEDFVGT
jgi:hypothetical protein